MKKITNELEDILKKTSEKLKKISEEQASIRPAPEKWSQKEILGHLVDSAANNHQRFVRLQIETNLNMPSYKQDMWVKLQNYQNLTWDFIVNLWSIYNQHLLHVLRNTSENKLLNTCCISEDFGDEPITLLHIIEDYVRHMKHHLLKVFELKKEITR